jgi:flavorubredoxin
MKAIEIKPDIYWVGGKDSKLREFHGYKTHRGTSYNAYLIIDEKITLVDTVKSSLEDDMIKRLTSIIDPQKIDYIVCNHVEMDHSGVIPKMAKLAPNAEILASPNGDKGLHAHFFNSNLKIRTVKNGESISIGKRTLQFHHMQMVHWPDSMGTYIKEDKLLLPNDAFGQHYSCEHLFFDESPKDIVIAEAAKYYANIVLPYGKQVQKALSALSSLEIDMIAPSHGLIWRNDDIPYILDKYQKWSTHQSENKAVIIYDTMWKSTRKMAKSMVGAFEEKNIPVKIVSLSHTHYSDAMADVLEAKYVFIGSPSLNNQMLPTVAAFLTYLKGLKPEKKVGFVFGSYGWSQQVVKEIDDVLRSLKWTMPLEPYKHKYIPSEDSLIELHDLAFKIIEETH